MGGFYLSLQTRCNHLAQIEMTLEKLCTKYGDAGMRLYYGETINSWTGIYPVMVEKTEKFAADLSKELGVLVILLASFDEDDFYCQFFLQGKLNGQFKIAAGVKRNKKGKETIVKALSNLSQICSLDSITALQDYLSHPEKVTFSSDLLTKFAQCTGIKNSLLSFDYIQKNDVNGGMEVRTDLQRMPRGEWRSKATPSSTGNVSTSAKKLKDTGSIFMESVLLLALGSPDWQKDEGISKRIKNLERFGISFTQFAAELEERKQNPNPEQDKKAKAITEAMLIAHEARTYRGSLPTEIKLTATKTLSEKSSSLDLMTAFTAATKGEWLPSVEQMAALNHWVRQSLMKYKR